MVTRADYEIIIEQGFDRENVSGVTIQSISPESPLQSMNLHPGDRIIRINGQPVHDLIDFHFLSGGESCLVLTVLSREGTRKKVTLQKNEDEPLGVEVETFKYRHCGNDCVFCFVDQNPEGMRKAMYFKDEDYRLSFLWGNFTTLTNTSQKDLHRIVQQRLSPLYVSIHATEPELRKKLLGIKRDDHLQDKLKYLADNHIEMHGQIVLCPGLNDGEHLQKTCRDLLAFYPALNTVAVVPLGLTRYREGLPVLQPVTPEYARDFVHEVHRFEKELSREGYAQYLYLADEWYLRANLKLPSFKQYGRFPQIENGVGIVRKFQRDYAKARKRLPERLSRKKTVHLMTSVSAAKFMKEIAEDCQSRTKNLEIILHPTVNYFYGESITVSGLLTGQDFLKEMQGQKPGDLVLLPTDCVKEDEDIFLDDMTVDELSRRLQCPVIPCREGADQMIDEIIKLA